MGNYLPDLTLAALLLVSWWWAGRPAGRPPADGTIALLFVAAAVAVFYRNEGGALVFTVKHFDFRDGLFFLLVGRVAWDVVLVGRRPLRLSWLGGLILAFLGLTGLSILVGWSS